VDPKKQLVRKKASEDDNSLGLNATQVAALEKLVALGAGPAEADEEGKIVYSKDPQTRALQLVFEGRFGGSGRGQGRPKRAAEEMAAHIRRNFTRRMTRALSRALKPDAGTRANLDAIRLAIDIEQRERKLQIEEEEHEGNIGNTREELLATLFNLVGDPATAAAIEGSSAPTDGYAEGALGIPGEAEEVTEEDIPEAEVIEEEDRTDPSTVGEDRSEATATSIATDGGDTGSTGSNGAGRSKRDRQTSTNPFTQAALRRAAERR
jgi:hypothetical protein